MARSNPSPVIGWFKEEEEEEEEEEAGGFNTQYQVPFVKKLYLGWFVKLISKSIGVIFGFLVLRI